MRAFVTGGSGFVGRNLIRALVERGDEVRALARSTEAAKAVEALGAQAVRGDLDDAQALAQGLEGCELVFHSAAYVKDWGPREVFERANVGGTNTLLGQARKAGVRRFVHIGTEAIFAGGPMSRLDESAPIPAKHVGLYPETKAKAEALVRASNCEAMATMVVRPRFIWGAGDTSLLPGLVEKVKAGGFAWIGGGRHLTHTCHIANVVEGALLAAERGKGGEVYFLTDGEPQEMRAFMTRMLQTQGVDPGQRELPLWLAKTSAWLVEAVWGTLRLKSEPPVTRTAVLLVGQEVTVSDAKARQALGYRAHKSIEDGLREMTPSS